MSTRRCTTTAYFTTGVLAMRLGKWRYNTTLLLTKGVGPIPALALQLLVP